MVFEDFIKKHSQEIIWATHIAVGAWIWWEGVILGKNIHKFIAMVVLGVSLYVYDKLHKALLAEQSKEPEIIYKEKPKERKKDYLADFKDEVDVN